MPASWSESEAEAIIDAHAEVEGALLPILHALQDHFGCVPDGATSLLAQRLNLSRAEVHGVISFYHDFRSQPPGKVVVKICRAEACQAMGAREAANTLLERLGVAWGETTTDKSVTVQAAYCLGLCAVAPAALINGAPAARLDGASLVAHVEAAR